MKNGLLDLRRIFMPAYFLKTRSTLTTLDPIQLSPPPFRHLKTMLPTEQAHSPASPQALSLSDGSMSKWFAEHVQPHEPALRAYLSRRFPTLPDHDDLVPETYVRVFRARDPSRLAFIKAFLFTTARNAAIDLFRRSRRHAHTRIENESDLRLLEEPPGVVEALERRQRLEILLEALGALPERCREVMMLRYIEGFACKEIAAHRGISLGTVKNHLLKGVHACSRHFEARGLVPPEAPTEKETS